LRVLAIQIWNTFLNLFTTRSTVEFERFTSSSLPSASGTPWRADQAPTVINVTPLKSAAEGVTGPADCEETFTALASAGRFDSAWDLLTPDSQASWKNKDMFVREMSARQPFRSLLGSKVREVRLLPKWTDEETKKTYEEVAELVVDYRVRQSSREMVVTRDVHLVNVSGGWKSLCYRT
jgi:hypothetical protein